MTKEKLISTAVLAALLIAATSCDNWGRKDPPAGNQVKATMENVAVYDFESEEGLDPAVFKAIANPGGSTPEITADDIKGNVLRLDNGYISLANPLNKVALQEAASFTFWMMQPVVTTTDEEGVESALPQDLNGPMITFENLTGNGRLAINPNGGIYYSAADGNWVENDPVSVTTGYITPGEWHYVAVIIDEDGYQWWVDGDRKVEKTVTDFDCSKLVRFANNVPVMTIGAADNNSLWMIDDLKVYRNTITAKEISRPNLGSGGQGGAQGPDLSTWVLLGNEDNSTGFWSTWSDYVNLTGNGTIHYEFYNWHGDNTLNWQNWALVLTNGIPRDGAGYAEYAYIRADAYGWGNAYVQDDMVSNFDWGTFMDEMEGALVKLDITRRGTSVTIHADVTAEDGTTRYEEITLQGVESETLGSFLTCEGAHLRINPEEVFVGSVFAPGEKVTGLTDCTTPWWSAHSDNNRFENSFDKWGVEFVNHTTGTGANWNNWLLIASNGPWVGEDGYAEYFVLRSDAYGWGSAFDQGNTTMESAFDWDTYVADMKDAKVKILFSYAANTLKMDCRQTTADGREMPRYKFKASGLTAPIGLFFTCELAYLEFSRIGYYPWMTVEVE